MPSKLPASWNNRRFSVCCGCLVRERNPIFFSPSTCLLPVSTLQCGCWEVSGTFDCCDDLPKFVRVQITFQTNALSMTSSMGMWRRNSIPCSDAPLSTQVGSFKLWWVQIMHIFWQCRSGGMMNLQKTSAGSIKINQQLQPRGQKSSKNEIFFQKHHCFPPFDEDDLQRRD